MPRIMFGDREMAPITQVANASHTEKDKNEIAAKVADEKCVTIFINKNTIPEEEELDYAEKVPELPSLKTEPILSLVRIVGMDRIQTNSEARFVFIIELKWSDKAVTYISRDYGDFFKHHRCLVDNEADVFQQLGSIPPLPEKKWFNNDPKLAVEERSPLLEAYLNQLAKVKGVEETHAFFRVWPDDPKENDPSLHKLLKEIKARQDEQKEMADNLLDENKNEEKCEVTVDESLKCGYGSWRPDCLQRFVSPKWFSMVLAIFSMNQGLIVMGLTAVAIPDIEKEFRLSSTDSGLILASNDIAGILLVPIVAFFGQDGKKPKWLGCGALITGLGSLLFSMPKAMIGKHVVYQTSVASQFCSGNGTSVCVEKASNTGYLAVLCLGQFIMGAGTTPLFTLGMAYLDENVNPKMSPIYIGCLMATTFLGPGLGFLTGGGFSQTYTDLKLPEGLQLSPGDSKWVGAWWMGFFVLSWTLLLSGFLLLCFPREMPEFKKKRSEALAKGDLKAADTDLRKDVRGFIIATFRLMKNVTFIFAVLGLTVRVFYGSAIGSFIAKIILLKFGGTSLEVALSMTVVLLPGMGGGILVGSFIMKRFKLKTSAQTAALMCSVFSLMTCVGASIFFVPGCETTILAGSTAPYQNRSLTNSFNSPCNSKCACARHYYNPVCGADGKTYFSPCYAGCKTSLGTKEFGKCSCISINAVNRTMNNMMQNMNNSQLNQGKKTMKVEATDGSCDRKCKNLIYFLIGIFLNVGISFISAIPQQMILLRSVPDNQRAYALGIKFLLMRSLSFIPAPMVFGSIIDSQCIAWSRDKCGNRGNCLDYEIEALSANIFYLGLTVGILAAICYFISWYFFKPDENIKNAEKVGINGEKGVLIDGTKEEHALESQTA